MAQPYYSSETAFRLYEPVIVQAIESLPNPISFVSPHTRTAATDTARCRDAITAWNINRWESPLASVSSLANDLRVWSYKNRTYIGSKLAHKEFHATLEFSEIHNRPFDLSHVKNYRLHERPFKSSYYDDKMRPRPQPLPFQPALTPRPLLTPRPFPNGHDVELPQLDINRTQEKLTSEPDASTPSLSELIDLIDSGELTERQHISIIHLDEVKKLTAGRLNVAFGIKDNEIILF